VVASAEECVALSERVLGPNHIEALAGMLFLATIYSLEGVGRYKEGLLLMQQALEVAERTLGSDHEFAISARRYVDKLLRETERAREGATPGATLPTTETTEGTPSSSTQPNIKGDATDTEASSRPRPRLRDSFKIRGWSKNQKEKGV
jgi:hypothetical protein